MVFYALLICSGENYPRTMIAGERGGSQIEKNQTALLEILFEREKKAWEGQRRRGGFLHMCITNIRQKNLSTNKGLQSNIYESTGQWQHGEGVSGWEDEQEGGGDRARETEKLEGDGLGRGFCVTKWQSG